MIGLRILFALAFVAPILAEDLVSDLKSLCANQHVELNKISQVEGIVDLLKSGSDEGACSAEVKEAILSIEGAIQENDDVCTLEKVQKIRDFHNSYILKSADSPKSEHLPTSLKEFFVGYGLKVDSICKKSMISHLVHINLKVLHSQDTQQMNKWTQLKNNLMDKLGNPKDFDDILLAGELHRLSKSPSANKKIHLKVSSSDYILDMQDSCNSRFKPIYEKVITPIVELATLGYNYKGEDMERELKEIGTNIVVNRWYKTVYLCEAVNGIEVVDSKDVGKDEVRILTEDEVKQLKVDGSARTSKYRSIKYEPEGGNPIGDTVVESGDEQLIKLIKNFDSNKKDTDIIKKKFLSKVGEFIKEIVLKGNFKLVNSLLQGQGLPVPKEKLVRAVDEFVVQEQRELERPKQSWFKRHSDDIAIGFFMGLHVVLGLLFLATIGVAIWATVVFASLG